MVQKTSTKESRSAVVIGGGIVGISCALFLQRDGWMVTVVDPSDPGSPDQTSYGNAGSISSSSVMPTALPGVIKQVPKMLADPTGPLAIQWRYLPRLLPFLASFLRYSSRANVEASGRAIAGLIHRRWVIRVTRTRVSEIRRFCEGIIYSTIPTTLRW